MYPYCNASNRNDSMRIVLALGDITEQQADAALTA
jgi:hypothetical protein